MSKYIEKWKQTGKNLTDGLHVHWKEEWKRQDGEKRPDYQKRVCMLLLRNTAFLLVAAALLRGAVVFWGDSVHASNTVGNRELPIYCVKTDEAGGKKIALTFDAAWGNEDTKKILEILKKNNVKVTFFMTGGWVSTYPDMVKEIYNRGHDLGNHSENHKEMSKLNASEQKEEITAVDNKIKELTGYECFLFRPPYGDYNSLLINTVYGCNHYPVQWDVDSLDWKDYGVDSIIKTVTRHKALGNGSIILMHNGAKFTAEALDTVLTSLEEQGYEIVPVSQLIIRENFHMDGTGRQIGD